MSKKVNHRETGIEEYNIQFFLMDFIVICFTEVSRENRPVNNSFLSLCNELRNKDVVSQSWFFSDQIFSMRSVHISWKSWLCFSDSFLEIPWLYIKSLLQSRVQRNTECCNLHKADFHIFLGIIQFLNNQNTEWPVLTFSSVAAMVCKIQRLQGSHNLPSASIEQFLNNLNFIV